MIPNSWGRGTGLDMELARRERNQIGHVSVDLENRGTSEMTLQTRTLALAWLLAVALPLGGALAAGGGGAGSGSAAGGGTGAAGMGSAAVGGGAPAGRVGGGPPAGQVGGGAPGLNDAASNGAAGTGNPSTNSPAVQIGPDNPAAGLENAPTNGGVIGGTTGVPPKSVSEGGSSPPVMGQGQPVGAPGAVQGVAEQPPPSTVGLAKPGPDGVSTRIVKPIPCGVAAHETDGTTTCVGIPTTR